MSINDSQQKTSVKMTLFQYFQAVNFVLFLRITHFEHESLLWSLRCLVGRMAMHACQIGPTDTALPCLGSLQRTCIVTRGDLWNLMKHFCELFPEKIFNFSELSGLDYFRKWVVTPWHGRFRSFDQCRPTGKVAAQVCNSWKILRQYYSTSSKKQKPKQMFSLSEICLLWNNFLFLIITHGSENGFHEKTN